MKRYPCTGHLDLSGFSDMLGRELGPSRKNLHAFAAELAREFAAPHVTLVNSGSSANLAAAVALREVCEVQRPRALIAGFTFPTTASALLTAGFDVHVVDTEPGGFCIDPAAVARVMGPEVAVIAATHFLGFPAALDALPLCHLLVDACESMAVSARATLTTWSFYHPHHLSAYGGGAVIAQNAAMQRILESIAHWGRECVCHVPSLECRAPPGRDHNFTYVRQGFNLEMSELNACFGRFQLARFTADEVQRKRRYAILLDALAELREVTTWPMPADWGSPFVFPIAVDSAERCSAVCDRLFERGVEARTLMGGAITGHFPYAHLPNDGLANCRDLSARAFFVGIHQTLPEDDVRAVAAILRGVLG